MAKKLTDYSLDDLYLWIEEGQDAKVPEEFIAYVNMLDKIRAMKLRADIYASKEAIIKHLVTFEAEIKGNRIKATELYNEALEYFYCDSGLSKAAWRNLYAENADKDYELARALAENSSDMKKASDISERAWKFRGLDKDDEKLLPDNFADKPLKVYTMDMDHFEVGNEDRKEIEIWVDENSKDLNAKQIDRIKQEAGILKLKFFEDEE